MHSATHIGRHKASTVPAFGLCLVMLCSTQHGRQATQGTLLATRLNPVCSHMVEVHAQPGGERRPVLVCLPLQAAMRHTSRARGDGFRLITAAAAARCCGRTCCVCCCAASSMRCLLRALLQRGPGRERWQVGCSRQRYVLAAQRLQVHRQSSTDRLLLLQAQANNSMPCWFLWVGYASAQPSLCCVSGLSSTPFAASHAGLTTLSA